MQLILTEKDIHQALENYVREMIVVKDGMTIDIELKATRGEAGNTAIINIERACDVVKEPLPSTTPAKPAPKQEVSPTKATNEEPVLAQEKPPVTPEDPVEAAPKRTLFSGMTKPVNE